MSLFYWYAKIIQSYPMCSQIKYLKKKSIYCLNLHREFCSQFNIPLQLLFFIFTPLLTFIHWIPHSSFNTYISIHKGTVFNSFFFEKNNKLYACVTNLTFDCVCALMRNATRSYSLTCKHIHVFNIIAAKYKLYNDFNRTFHSNKKKHNHFSIAF